MKFEYYVHDVAGKRRGNSLNSHPESPKCLTVMQVVSHTAQVW